MRIVTLITGPEAAPTALRLSEEIQSFNAEIDFRLRFLHVEIEEVVVAPPGAAHPGAEALDGADRPTVAAARLALLLARERPAVLVAVGEGPLLDAAAAAAEAADVRFARFAAGEPAHEAEIDLGSEPAAALDRLTGVAREIR
ncbi:MAG: hypothetical protein ACYTHK_12110 [Planctomycetota bacterium]|jgi:hypothetical protein